MGSEWSLFSNHGLVLVTLARMPDLRLRELADTVGITERAVQGIVADLVESGYLERTREGRRNRYLVRGDHPLPGPVNRHLDVSDLIHALVPGPLMGPADAPLRALVLACSDHRYQESLRSVLAAEGLLGGAEIMLWPGGSSALAGPDADRILAAMAVGAGGGAPARLVLVAHEGCNVPGAFVNPRRDPFSMRRAVNRRRRLAVEKVRRVFGVEPELWFLDARGAHRVRTRSDVPQPKQNRPERATDSGPREEARVVR